MWPMAHLHPFKQDIKEGKTFISREKKLTNSRLSTNSLLRLHLLYHLLLSYSAWLNLTLPENKSQYECFTWTGD